MNCLIYLRVSTKEQAETDETDGLSIKAQREACLKYIQDKDWNFVDEYVDRGESARSADRPQLQEMLSKVNKDQTINAVVVHKIDRLARNMGDHAAIRAILERKDVALVSVVENLEDSASGRLIEGILAVLAEYYSANLAMEVKKGMNQKVKSGIWPHRAPIGYLNERVKIDGREIAKIVVDNERAPLIQQTFELYATGEYSMTELTETMRQKGLTTIGSTNWPARPVGKSTLANILSNKFYTGKMVWKKMELDGTHEPLISQNLYERAQEVLKIHDQAGERKRKHPHYLRGTVYCGECGSRMSSQTAKREYLYFFCGGQSRRNGCKQPYIPGDVLEKAVEDLYKDIELPREYADKLIDDSRKELAKREVSLLRETEFQGKRIAKLNRERKRLLEAYLAEAIDTVQLKEQQDRIAKEILEAETRLQALSSHNDLIEERIELMIKMASNCYLAYMKGSPETRRKFNQAFFKKISVKNKKISEKEFTEPFEALFGSNNVNMGDVGLEPNSGFTAVPGGEPKSSPPGIPLS